MKHMSTGLVALAVIGLLIPWGVLAVEGDIVLANDERVTDNYVRSGRTITVDGLVEQDATLVARQVTLNGQINGDLLVMATTVVINGTVEGSVRIMANDVLIRGTIGRNASIAANTLVVSSDAAIGQSLGLAASAATIDGFVSGSLSGYVLGISVNGQVKGSADLHLPTEDLTIGPEAVISGGLRYSARSELTLPEGQIGGVIERLPQRSALEIIGISPTAFRVLYLVGLLIVGLLIMFLFPQGTKHILTAMQHRPFVKLSWGIVVLLAVPVVAVILTLSVIGLPLAILLLGVYGVFIYLSPAFIGLAIGQWLWQQFLPRQRPLPVLPTIIGVVLFFALTAIPLFGGWIWLLGILWFLGSVAARKLQSIKEHELPVPERTA